MRPEARLQASFGGARLARFAGVGLAGFAVQLAVLWALARTGLPALIATALAVEAAVLHNFLWHQRWTWADRTGDGVRRRLLRFHVATGLVSIAGNVVLTAVYITVAHVSLLTANILAVATMSLVTFAVADRWVFSGVSSRVRSLDRTGSQRPSSFSWVPQRPADAADLKPATLQAWDRYVQSTESRLGRELADQNRFLAVDFDGSARSREVRRQLLAGQIVVEPVVSMDQNGAEIEVPSGSIHHWRGYIYIPNTSVDNLITAVHDPDGRRAHHQQDVLVARVLSRDNDSLRLYLKLQRSAIVTIAYNPSMSSTAHATVRSREQPQRGDAHRRD